MFRGSFYHLQLVRIVILMVPVVSSAFGQTVPNGTEQQWLELMEAIDKQNPFLSDVEGYPMRSAFMAIKWQGARPFVEIDNQWYEVLALQGLAIEDIRRKCDDEQWRFKKRFEEDHARLLQLMGQELGEMTNLTVRNAAGQVEELRNVPMTEEKRLRQRVFMSRDATLCDLNVFHARLKEQFAYLETNGFDLDAAVAGIRDRIGKDNDLVWLTNELQAIMAQFIDGHAEVSGPMHEQDGYLPFLIVPTGDRFAAVQPDRAAVLDSKHPYIEAIDGVPIAELLKAASRHVARGSSQYRKRHALRQLRNIGEVRSELGIQDSDTLKVRLSDDSGGTVVEVLQVADEKPLFGLWPPLTPPRVIELDEKTVGYLRLFRMDDEAVELIRTWLPKFRDTDGLIIDVRGNGGGSREPLLELSNYLMSPEDQPRIVNVAKYRLGADFRDDHLSGARFVYREDSGRFDDRELDAVRTFQRSFRPEWTPPEFQFSEWHYLVLSKKPSDQRFHYPNPVVILMDEYCFSATDIFLSALKGWPNVTLVGQASGGGSARTERFRLANSRISIYCASMASFQADGRLYDSHGVEPDIAVARTPLYYIHDGPDLILEKAISLLHDDADTAPDLNGEP